MEARKHIAATLKLNLQTDGLEAALECVNRARSVLRRAIVADRPKPKNRNQETQTTRPQIV
jgi:hypothetical protein